MVILTIHSTYFINLTWSNVLDEYDFFPKIYFFINGNVCINKIYKVKKPTYIETDRVVA